MTQTQRPDDVFVDSSQIEETSRNDHMRILVATDLHIGFAEKILGRDEDSIRTFEEVLQIASREEVDFVLLGGDLYHENNPSREMQHRVTQLLRRYCLNDRPVALRFLSDPVVNFRHSAFGNVNYEDSNINVGLPIFTIHGNHDDLSGKGLTALDILHESGLINLFGKFEEIDQFIVSPILLVKGKTKLALYGIGSQRDDRLCRAFREEEIRFLRPKEDAESWFNILVLHQNRPVRTRERSTGGHLPENLIPSFFDLVIWGHEHECKIDPQYYESGINVCGDGFYIIQPGSTVATALSPEEAKPKHVALITISGRKFFSQKMALETPRQFLFADLAITVKPPSTASKNSRSKNMPDEKLIAAEVEKMLAEAEKMKTTRQAHPPLLRLRVTYPESWANIMKLNCRQFGAAYSRRIANPSDMITVKILKSKNEGKKRKDGFKVATNIERATTVEEIVNTHFAAQGNDTLMVLDTGTLSDVVKFQVEQEDGKRVKNKLVIENLQIKKKKLIDALCKVSYDSFLSFDKIPSHQFLEQFEELINSDIKKVNYIAKKPMYTGEENHRQSIFIDLQEQIDSIAPNKCFTRVAAAGSKGLLKIFAIEENGFNFVADFRSVRSRRLNLLYSASHVSWSHLIDNMIATTSTNGAVVLWNVEKAALHRTYKAHTRSATKVCFHQANHNTLISGAKDAAVIQYDFRIPEPVKKFISGSCDPIRDMQFGIHPSHYDIFVAADDGGSVRFWDLRKNDRPLYQFVAHHGPSSVALNPSYDDQNLIATAGRDKFIRIWKWFDRSESQSNSAMYSVEATASISRVYWRPMHKYQVASCSVVSDINIHVWDIRRPFLPFANLAWKENDAEIFLSAGKDGLLVMHFVENAHHPMNHVSDVAVDISPTGTIAVAVSSQLNLKHESLIEQEKALKGEAFVRRRRKYDPFQSSIPSYLICCEPTETNIQVSSQHFITLAKKYKLYGDNASSLCFYNSRIAEDLKKYDIAHTWRVVGFICQFTSFFEKSSSEETSSGSHENAENNGASTSDGAVRSRFPSSLSSGGVVRNVDGQDVTDSIFSGVIPQTISTSSDFFFGDNELNLDGLNNDLSDFTLPYDFKAPTNLKMEAFTPRPYEEFEAGETSCSPSSEEHLDDIMPNHTNELKRCQIGNLRIRAELACPPLWDPLPLLCSMFNFYSDLGDVQTCVSVLLVLGEKSKEFIDLGTQKVWFLDYINMLECYELWNTSAEVIKLCWIAAVNSLSNESTSIKLLCTKCKTVSVTASPYCKKCRRKFDFNCSLCSLPVHGIWSWCRGCAHGGHPHHYAEWFATNKKCPTGCGHSCVQ
uniref:WD_REPEATS_REGION domain-containing protein n=1 Tax=Onchocerca volvulus TaxID=6282 RepID=A0A8R1XZU4_ONCVO